MLLQGKVLCLPQAVKIPQFRVKQNWGFERPNYENMQ